MATLSAINNESANVSSAARVDMKFEVVVIPVTDVDRSKAFYTMLGWRLDADFPFDNGFRVVQFTPPGSGCSVQFGTKITTAAPGSSQGLYLIVSNVEAARKELVARGVEVSEVFHASKPGAQFRPESDGRISGPDPGHRSYFSFATFSDPDGNTWLFQEITTRLPGRDEGFDSGVDPRSAWIRAAFGSVGLLCDQPSVPGEDGVGFGHVGYLLQSFASESFANVSQRATLRIRQVQQCRQVCAENTVLRSEVLVLQKQFLIDQPRDIRQQTSPLIAVHANRPSSQVFDSQAVPVF